MNLPLRIARRYFFSRHKKQFINIISIISMLVVAVGTGALIVALSVFNGLESLVKDLRSSFNPDLQITAQTKSFEVNKKFIKKIQKIKGVEAVGEVIEDNILLRYKQNQVVAIAKGVQHDYFKKTSLGKQVLQTYQLRDKNIVLGALVAYRLAIPETYTEALQAWYPKRTQKIKFNFDPERSFNKQNAYPLTFFSIEQEYDEKYVFVPLEFMQKLLEYKNKRTSIEIKLKDNTYLTSVQRDLEKVLGSKFLIKNRNQQDATLLKAIQVEKLFMFITLSFILGIASINIFFTLMMLAIDKKKDLAVLQSMGATSKVIRQVFMYEGSLIAFIGTATGLLLGLTLILLQQVYGLVPMGTTSTLITYYPVEMRLMDFVYTGSIVILITILASYFPARKASKIDIKENI